MNLIGSFNKFFGNVNVEIEGFFTERFLNICKFNRINIWDVQNIINGRVRFKVAIKDFKKLRNIAKKTKCKVKIKDKKGFYFILFRYRKRKILFLLFIIFVLIFIASNKFIWKIEVIGNNKYLEQDIINSLDNIGVRKGILKNNINSNKLSKELRFYLKDASFISTEIVGTRLIVNIKEKVIGSESNVSKVGDIYASKDGILKKVVVENGTCKYKIGSYIQKDMMVIEGKIHSQYVETKDVKASGKVYIQSEYIFEKKYDYNAYIKKMLPNIRYNIGFSINFKEFYINYLNKSKKYDKIKYSKGIKLFNNNISFDLYKFIEYYNENKIFTVDEIKIIFNNDSLQYINNIKNKSKEFNIVDEKVDYKINKDAVICTKKFIINEEIGKFIER